MESPTLNFGKLAIYFGTRKAHEPNAPVFQCCTSFSVPVAGHATRVDTSDGIFSDLFFTYLSLHVGVNDLRELKLREISI